jgi:hypothetical protein
LHTKRELWATLAIIVIVFVALALPYGFAETYGIQIKNLSLLVHVVSAAFCAALLIWWLARYKQTGRAMETLREEIHRKIHGRNESEHTGSEEKE